MPETRQEWFSRVSRAVRAEGYRGGQLQQWSTWPWTGELTPKELEAPVDAEPARRGTGGEDCRSCGAGRDPRAAGAAWWDEHFYLMAAEESSLPFAAFLMPREHADLGDLTPAAAARQGELLTAVERAACATLDVPRIQAARWGDGGEHLHWWLYARPTGMLQLRGTFLSSWDDLLPARPVEDVQSDARLWAAALVEQVGGSVLPA